MPRPIEALGDFRFRAVRAGRVERERLLQIILAGNSFGKFVRIVITFAMAGALARLAAFVAKRQRDRLHWLARQRRFRRAERQRRGITFRRERDVQRRMRERQLGLGQTDEIARVMRRDGERQAPSGSASRCPRTRESRAAAR